MKSVCTRMVVISALIFCSVCLGGTYSGGSGTAEDPYQIGTPEQMNAIGANPADWASHFVLMADLDMSVYTGTQYNIIGNLTTQFTGTFDGDRHILTNLTITRTSENQIGLFGRIGLGGQVVNLGLENVNITGQYSVGGLAGSISQGTLKACYATGVVSGSQTVGGLVGWNGYGTLTTCYAIGTVSGYWSVGGLMGCNNYGTITGCYAASMVSGSGEVGGLAGRNWEGTITACYATGMVSGTEDNIGGLVGFSRQGTATACFWDIQTTSQAGSAGGKGLTTEQMKTLSIYQNAGWADRGWVMQDGVGFPRLSWENTEGTPIPPAMEIPLAGSGTAEDPFVISTVAEFAALSWYSGILDKHILLSQDLDLSGITLYPIGVLGPFTGVFEGHGYILSNVVIQQAGSDSVGLFAHVGSDGLIRNLGLENVTIDGRRYVGGLVGRNEGGTIIACNIAGEARGTDDYVGGLAGHNQGTVKACYTTGTVSGKEWLGGLVGFNDGGTLMACHATGTIDGSKYSSSYVGGLVGWNSNGTIMACSATGKVQGYLHVGGLVGYNNRYNNSGTITACYATGMVRGTGGSIGGLVGYNDGTIMACYATGTVSGHGSIGGLVAFNNGGTITACYATGRVSGQENVGGLVGEIYQSTIAVCFWDNQTSGKSVGVGIGSTVGITGKSTKEMKTLATFTGVGWDFVGESANGTADIWRMCTDGVDYPRLSWELSRGGDLACPDGVAVDDLLYLAERWMATTAATAGAADANGDGKVDMQDMAILAENWMR